MVACGPCTDAPPAGMHVSNISHSTLMFTTCYLPRTSSTSVSHLDRGEGVERAGVEGGSCPRTADPRPPPFLDGQAAVEPLPENRHLFPNTCLEETSIKERSLCTAIQCHKQPRPTESQAVTWQQAEQKKTISGGIEDGGRREGKRGG